MKKTLPILALLALALFAEHWLLTPPVAFAQSFGAMGIGAIAPTVGQCPAGSAGFAYICPVGSGTTFQLYVSYNGAAYSAIGLAGPAGPQGPTGPTGAQGPPGPALSSCPNAALGASTGLTFGTGCK